MFTVNVNGRLFSRSRRPPACSGMMMMTAAALCAGAFGAPDDLLKLTLLSDEIPAASGGRCMDGSGTAP